METHDQHPPMVSRRLFGERVGASILRFLRVEATSGLALLAAALVALTWANSPWSETYFSILHAEVEAALGTFRIAMSLHHAINDGLMTLFFFVVGLEIKRELLSGELRHIRAAMLPITAALGGMAIPALIYLAFQNGTPAAHGWGIPMATDIAFAVGILSLLGRRIPHALKVFLLASAIVDDLGAIVIIAIFYAGQLDVLMLASGFLGLLITFGLQRVGVHAIPVYIVLGLLVWYAFLQSGVHPTIAGILLGFLTPHSAKLNPEQVRAFALDLANRLRRVHQDNEGDRWEQVASNMNRLKQDSLSPLSRLQHNLHLWVAFGVMPLFALANAGVSLNAADLTDQASVGLALSIGLGLLAGKPLGITLFSFLAIRLRIAQMPSGTSWGHLLGAGILAGIGFTVALFIATLSFENSPLLAGAKVGILAGSAVSAVIGLLVLRSLPSRLPV